MPSRRHALEPGGPQRLELSWGAFWKNFTVRLDGKDVGTIPDSKALKEGRTFRLPDGSTLEIRLHQGFGNVELQVSRDGKPLPGSGGDPAEKVRLAVGMVGFVAGLNALLGLLVVVFDVQFLADIGLGWGSLLFAAIYAGLAVAVWKFRSRVALGLAVGLFALDGLATLAMSIGASGSPPVGGIVARIFFILPMVRGIPALAQVQAAEQARTAQPGGSGDGKNPYEPLPRG